MTDDLTEDGVARQPNDAYVARLLDTLGSEEPPRVPPERREHAVQAALAAYDAASLAPDLAARRLQRRSRWQVGITSAAAAAVLGGIIGGFAATGGLGSPKLSASSNAGAAVPVHLPARAGIAAPGGHQSTGVHAAPPASGTAVQLRPRLGGLSCPADYPGAARPLPAGAAGIVIGPAAGSRGCLRVGPAIVTGRVTGTGVTGSPGTFLIRLARPVLLPSGVVAVTDRGVALGRVAATGTPGVVVLHEGG